MPIDQSKLGQHISGMMEAIEDDPSISDNAQIGDIVTIVEILDPGPGEPPKPGDEVELRQNIRRRWTGMPQKAIGLLTQSLFGMLNETSGRG
jgi:hypothetical protein